MSLRTRLALVLGAVVLVPLLTAGIVVGVLVVRAGDNATAARVAQAARSASTALAERCQGVGDLARSVAVQIGVGDTANAHQVVADAVQRRPGVSVVVVGPKGSVVAEGGPPAPAVEPGATPGSCSQGSSAAQVPALSETVPVTGPGGGDVASVRVAQPLDRSHLDSLRRDLGLTVDLALVRQGRLASTTAPVDVATAVTRGATSGLRAGTQSGWAYETEPEGAGVPFQVVALSQGGDNGSLVATLIGLCLAAALIALGLVVLIASGLVRPLRELTGVAERLGQGDLTARTSIRANDEVGQLAAAFNAMAGRMQQTVGEIERSRDVLGETFQRFGEALGRTHDLDGLLQTVLDAAIAGSDACVGAIYLGEGTKLEVRAATTSPDAPASSSQALEPLAQLARKASTGHTLARAAEVSGAGPALAVPMRRGERVVGALALARAAGAADLDAGAASAVEALATQAGTAVGNVREHEETQRLSVTDPLTGAGNFRHLSTTLAREIERAARFGRPMGVLMLDLDHFKRVNDSFGHHRGDAVLREIARRMADCVREVDTVARYGGEEFTVVLPETDADGAARVAARIVESVRELPVSLPDGPDLPVTVSIGVAAYPEHGRTAGEVMRAADAALYAAKRTGRDRWAQAGPRAAGASAPASPSRPAMEALDNERGPDGADERDGAAGQRDGAAGERAADPAGGR